ncbi:pyridoxal kinase [Sphaceloma murrayae]|uniref:pyridoxal kinase n=1 Tax=Sphaceloma murrayae TaxID=2082308 RepID=A0A2K1QZF3_9PEZI|nr:pyridoxal kinase [Sphaceloma murrayae]
MADIPDTHVLAIASHVTYGYVGNTMATFVMQSLGCEVSAINTVNFSNHTAYRQVKGRKTPWEEVAELYEGLKDSGLNDFDMMLSGYCPSAEVVGQVGRIAREKKLAGATRPGSFFWVLDPVMGDNGKIYVQEDTVPAYKGLLKDADLILPNQFEAELLSGVQITDEESLAKAVQVLHLTHRVPHIIITSVRFGEEASHLSVIGSSARSDMSPRLFKLTAEALPVFFSGTGDMFAALMVARLREACNKADLLKTSSWQSPDDVDATDLPLAKAAETVLSSMHAVLEKTMKAREEEVKKMEQEVQGHESGEKKKHLRLTKAAEVRVVKNVKDLISPQAAEKFEVVPMGYETTIAREPQPDELGVVKAGLGDAS